MQTLAHRTSPTTRWLILFLAAHLIAWTMVPALVRYNLPLDAIEGTLWGQQLQWGYDKNPYLNGWLTALAVQWSSPSGWMVYLFSQISVVACFWAVWRLGKQLLGPAYAFIAVLLLEGIQYYHFHAIDFNDNTLELGLWALAITFFYSALTSNTYRYWILTGLFAGFGLMAKYYTAALLAGMLLFLLINKTNRQRFATLPPYIGFITFLIIIIPHIIWLFFHNFVTVHYVFARASSVPSWTNHFYFPALFAWQQIEAFLPALILFAIIARPQSPQKISLNLFDKQFLFFVCLGPFLLTLLLSLCLGINLRAGWGMPLLSFWGIILIALAPPNLTPIKLKYFTAGIFILMSGLLTAYSWSLIHASTPSSANFPGKTIANVITQEWQDQYHTKLNYVAGSRWLGGNISFYSKDHPAVFVEWNPEHAAWINDKSLRDHGAVFIWEVSANETLPITIQQQYPTLGKPKILTFAWRRDHHHLTPIQIGIALLPPALK